MTASLQSASLRQCARRGMHVFAVVLLGACAAPAGPFPGVQLETEVTPNAAAGGDTVTIRAILHNPTERKVEVGGACGPPVLFEIRRSPSGAPIYPIPLEAAFLCPGEDYHVLDPGETDTVAISWRTPGPGKFAVRSGFRSGSGLQRLTGPAILTVQ